MTTETMGLPTNHYYHRKQPFEHKLDIKNAHNHRTPHYLYYVAYCTTLFASAVFFFFLSVVFGLFVDFSDRNSFYKMLNFSSLNSLDILNYVTNMHPQINAL